MVKSSYLQELREKANLTQSELAFISEISYLDLVKYEEGFKALTLESSMILASFLGCDYRELMGENDG